ncbi:MAG: dolichol kinase [Ignavibacteria bacterium]|nr:dolichol kinase [Ignavibacteria bacterium]
MQNPENIQQNSTPIRGEILRKLIHYASSAIPISYLFLEKNFVLIILGIILVLMLIVEFLKYKSDFIYNFYTKNFKFLLREHEYDRRKFRINGASWVIFAAIVCIAVFPKIIAVTGLLILVFADSTSALVGRYFGKKQYAPNRSYVGTITFFMVGVIVMLLTPKFLGTSKEYAVGMIAVLATTVADSLILPVDDNLTIPLTCCTVMYLMYVIFLPGVI